MASTPVGAKSHPIDKSRQASTKRDVKILMLHGYTQSGPLFRAKTRALEKLLQKSLGPFGLNTVLIYPTGPIRLSPKDIPGYTPPEAAPGSTAEDQEPESYSWFRRNEVTQKYMDFDKGMATIADAIREAGGVEGVIGFSQGGAMAALLAASLEKPERSSGEELEWLKAIRESNDGKPLKFATIYSGFFARDDSLASWLYEPKIQTATLHYIGSLDTVVEEERTQGLVDRCQDPISVVHPGGHYVPVAKEWVMPLIGFIKTHTEA